MLQQDRVEQSLLGLTPAVAVALVRLERCGPAETPLPQTAGCGDRKFGLFKTSNPTERSNQRSAIDSHPASVMAGAI